MSFERLAPEQHDTLEGVPEPSENPRLVGHRSAGTALAAAHRAGRLPQGVILAGRSGTGKATFGFHLARHLLRSPDGASAPDGFAPADPVSSLFRQVASGAHPSVLHLTRPFNEKTKTFKTVIAVDEVRRIGRFLSHTAHDGGYRVVIVDPADDMNVQAANALLKNLEEPPSKTLFLLITHALGRLLPTLRSRCQIMKLSPLGPDELAEALQGLVPNAPAATDARAELHRRASGSVRQAILLLEHGGLEITSALEALTASARFDPVEAHRIAEAVGARGREVPFEIMKAHVLDTYAAAAAEAAVSGQLGAASRLSEAWAAARRAADDAAAFNLDRKQQALELLGRLHAAVRG